MSSTHLRYEIYPLPYSCHTATSPRTLVPRGDARAWPPLNTSNRFDLLSRSQERSKSPDHSKHRSRSRTHRLGPSSELHLQTKRHGPNKVHIEDSQQARSTVQATSPSLAPSRSARRQVRSATAYVAMVQEAGALDPNWYRNMGREDHKALEKFTYYSSSACNKIECCLHRFCVVQFLIVSQ
ncbi:hypothetical protein HPB48_027081 [Haemaphysalis longicornis]|uniref:Uncharacterized protein n=1 Tax=Haemaphysalis longicornis TaxID=44386 RepID=A0A9J6HD20_HAELO|nr:hypothetical protein HPB48_027081 [Haemaphysalis longicornis]